MLVTQSLYIISFPSINKQVRSADRNLPLLHQICVPTLQVFFVQSQEATYISQIFPIELERKTKNAQALS